MKVLMHMTLPERPNGGPAAVCYYYNQEKIKRGDDSLTFLETGIKHHLVDRWEQKVEKIGVLKALLKNLRSFVHAYNVVSRRNVPVSVDYNVYDIIYFHEVHAIYCHLEQLASFKGRVILQSHTPEPPSIELFNSFTPFVRRFYPGLKHKLEKIEVCAFERADYIVFPCEEAEEPYLKNMPLFSTIKSRKKDRFLYILTGINEPVVEKNREDVRKELNLLEDSFIVSYVGRHNVVKGYDVLKEIATKFLEDENAQFIIAGKEEPLTRLDSPNWRELGWTQIATSYINASDVFVLPNRETYFDIVMLEVLALGKIVLASNTGGNRFFKQCKGVFLYDDVNDAVDKLKSINKMSPEERNDIGMTNKEFFKRHLTTSAMYENYLSVIKSIV